MKRKHQDGTGKYSSEGSSIVSRANIRKSEQRRWFSHCPTAIKHRSPCPKWCNITAANQAAKPTGQGQEPNVKGIQWNLQRTLTCCCDRCCWQVSGIAERKVVCFLYHVQPLCPASRCASHDWHYSSGIHLHLAALSTTQIDTPHIVENQHDQQRQVSIRTSCCTRRHRHNF